MSGAYVASSSRWCQRWSCSAQREWLRPRPRPGVPSPSPPLADGATGDDVNVLVAGTAKRATTVVLTVAGDPNTYETWVVKGQWGTPSIRSGRHHADLRRGVRLRRDGGRTCITYTAAVDGQYLSLFPDDGASVQSTFTAGGGCHGGSTVRLTWTVSRRGSSATPTSTTRYVDVPEGERTLTVEQLALDGSTVVAEYDHAHLHVGAGPGGHGGDHLTAGRFRQRLDRAGHLGHESRNVEPHGADPRRRRLHHASRRRREGDDAGYLRAPHRIFSAMRRPRDRPHRRRLHSPRRGAGRPGSTPCEHPALGDEAAKQAKAIQPSPDGGEGRQHRRAFVTSSGTFSTVRRRYSPPEHRAATGDVTTSRRRGAPTTASASTAVEHQPLPGGRAAHPDRAHVRGRHDRDGLRASRSTRSRRPRRSSSLPAPGSTLTSTPVTLTGTTSPGARVTVYDATSNAYRSATADSSGSWTVTLDRDFFATAGVLTGRRSSVAVGLMATDAAGNSSDYTRVTYQTRLR